MVQAITRAAVLKAFEDGMVTPGRPHRLLFYCCRSSFVVFARVGCCPGQATGRGGCPLSAGGI